MEDLSLRARALTGTAETFRNDDDVFSSGMTRTSGALMNVNKDFKMLAELSGRQTLSETLPPDKTGEPQGKPCAVTIIDPAAKGSEKIIAFCFLLATKLESDRE